MAKHSQPQGKVLYGPPAWCSQWVVGLAVLAAIAMVVYVAAKGGTF